MTFKNLYERWVSATPIDIVKEYEILAQEMEKPAINPPIYKNGRIIGFGDNPMSDEYWVKWHEWTHRLIAFRISHKLEAKCYDELLNISQSI